MNDTLANDATARGGSQEALPVHPSIRDPRTGGGLRAVGIVSGRPVWPVMGASDPVPAPSPAPADAPPAPAPAAPAPAPAEKTFTQAELDRIIAGRLAKYSDYDELKAQADAAAAANRTDLERAVAAAKQETETAVRAESDKVLVSAEIRAAAAELGFRDPADALVQYGEDALKAVKVDAGGVVDTAAVRARLEEIAKAKAYLIKDGAPPVAAPGAAGIGVGGGTVPAAVAPGLPRLQAAYAAGPRNK